MLTETTSKILDERGDDAATICGWSDRHPATIVKRTPKTITVQEDRHYAAFGDGPALTPQLHIFERDHDAPLLVYTLRKNGRWIRKGSPANSRGACLALGVRSHYRDPSF